MSVGAPGSIHGVGGRFHIMAWPVCYRPQRPASSHGHIPQRTSPVKTQGQLRCRSGNHDRTSPGRGGGTLSAEQERARVALHDNAHRVVR